MELTPYLDGLRRDLAAAAAPGGPDVSRAADLLAGSLDASARLCLLEVLSDAAAEITTKLDDATVDVQLRGREAQFVVTRTATDAPRVPVPGWRIPSPATWCGSPCACPKGSRTRSSGRPPRPACRSTPGWSGRSAAR